MKSKNVFRIPHLLLYTKTRYSKTFNFANKTVPFPVSVVSIRRVVICCPSSFNQSNHQSINQSIKQCDICRRSRNSLSLFFVLFLFLEVRFNSSEVALNMAAYNSPRTNEYHNCRLLLVTLSLLASVLPDEFRDHVQ